MDRTRNGVNDRCPCYWTHDVMMTCHVRVSVAVAHWSLQVTWLWWWWRHSVGIPRWGTRCVSGTCGTWVVRRNTGTGIWSAICRSVDTAYKQYDTKGWWYMDNENIIATTWVIYSNRLESPGSIYRTNGGSGRATSDTWKLDWLIDWLIEEWTNCLHKNAEQSKPYTFERYFNTQQQYYWYFKWISA